LPGGEHVYRFRFGEEVMGQTGFETLFWDVCVWFYLMRILETLRAGLEFQQFGKEISAFV